MTTNKKNNALVVEDCAKRIAGITKYVTDPNTEIPVAGKVCKAAEVIAVFQRDITARAAVDAAHAQVKATIGVRKPADAERRVFDKALKAWVENRFGADSAAAHEFGYSPPKPKVTTVATRAVAAAKSRATRAARHTMGAKQKAELKGTKSVIISPEEAAAIAAAAATASTAVAALTPNPEGGHPGPTPASGITTAPAAGSNGVAHS